MKTRLYHHTSPKGEIFTDQDEHDKALKKGWHPAPWLAVEPEKKVYEKPIIKEEVIATSGPKWPEKKEIKHCACGCGTPVNGTWVKGHQFRGREDGDKTDDQSTGPKHSE